MAKKVTARKPPTTPVPLTAQISPAPKVDARHRLDVKGWLASGRWVNVSSSNVSGIMYRAGEKRLFVQFKSGSIYYYLEVPAAVARDFFTASSMGIFLHRRIKGKFTHVGPLSTTPAEQGGVRAEERKRIALRTVVPPEFPGQRG